MYQEDELASQFEGLSFPYNLNYKIRLQVMFVWLVAAHHGTDDSGHIDGASPL